MKQPAYSEAQRDALQEVINIAMGRAVASLARILDARVGLSVPRVELVEAAALLATIQRLAGARRFTIVTQSFYHRLKGEVLVIFGENGCRELAQLMGYDTARDGDSPATERELLLDVANIVAGACLNGVAQQLDTDLSYSAPALVSDMSGLKLVLGAEHAAWSKALLVEVNFSLDHIDFRSHLIILLTEESIAVLAGVLDALLESV